MDVCVFDDENTLKKKKNEMTLENAPLDFPKDFRISNRTGVLLGVEDTNAMPSTQ